MTLSRCFRVHNCLKFPLVSFFSFSFLIPEAKNTQALVTMLSTGELLFIILVASALLVAIICNILVVVIIIRFPELRNPTNVLICNLAVSDFILASFVLPQNLHDISHTQKYHEGKLYSVRLKCPPPSPLYFISSIYLRCPCSFCKLIM